MPTLSIFLISLIFVTCLGACSTPSGAQPCMNRKRDKLQAIVAYHARAQLEHTLDWDALHRVFYNEPAVLQTSVGTFRTCLTKLVQYTNQLHLVNNTSGCAALHSQALSLEGPELDLFISAKGPAFSYCDSLMQALIARNNQDVKPCLMKLEQLMQQFGRQRDAFKL
jgi:hypothetical protein